MKRFMNMDHCSFFPDRVLGIYFDEPCYHHDVRYRDKTKSRWTSDLELFNDARKRADGMERWRVAAAHVIAFGMWVGVRSFGWYWYNKEGKE